MYSVKVAVAGAGKRASATWRSQACLVKALNPMARAVRRADMGLLVSGAVVFGVQTLVPAQDNTWLRREVKLPGCALNPKP